MHSRGDCSAPCGTVTSCTPSPPIARGNSVALRMSGEHPGAGRGFVSSNPLFDGTTLPTKSLAQIGDEVFRMFEANRKAE